MKVWRNSFLFERKNNLGHCVFKVIIYRPKYNFRNWSVKSVSVNLFQINWGLGYKIRLNIKNIWETLKNSENQRHK